MLALAALLTLLYALVNAFGAWMVVRRKGWVALLFMLAAALLIVSFVALLSSFDFALSLLLISVSAASVASFLNAHVVLGNVVWRFHMLRAAVGALIYGCAWLALRGL